MGSVKTGEIVRIGQDVGAACECGITVASPEVRTGSLNGRKTRRARCVDADARSGEAEEEADSAGHERSVATLVILQSVDGQDTSAALSGQLTGIKYVEISCPEFTSRQSSLVVP